MKADGSKLFDLIQITFVGFFPPGWVSNWSQVFLDRVTWRMDGEPQSSTALSSRFVL
jgi:hypothetical protein